MILSILVIGACCLYVYLATLSLTIHPRTLSHWLLFTSACCAAYWAFFAFFTYNAGTYEVLQRWFRISVLGMFFYFPVNLLFVVSVVPGRRVTIPLVVLITLPAAVLFTLNFFYPVVFSDFVMKEQGWMFVPATGTMLNLFWVLYSSSCFIIGITLMVIWRLKTSLNREKKQMAILITTQILTVVFLIFEYLFNDFLLKIRLATISPVIVSVWIIGMVLAVKRYQFLSITPEIVSREILNAIHEIIILINENEEITYMNNNALAFFGIPYRKLDHSMLSDFISGSQKEKALIPDVVTGTGKATGGGHEHTSFQTFENDLSGESHTDRAITLGLTLTTPHAGIADVTMRVTKVLDIYGDHLGYLLVGSEAKDIGTLQQQWGLTYRETQIVKRLIQGERNRHIAEELGVHEQTVKNHIAAVYKKLGVSNRVELLNLIGEQ